MSEHTIRLASTRSQTQVEQVFIRSTAGSQALERGLSILRAFRQGSAFLTNAEMADRTGIPRPTVSRLARSLVDSGFLIYDINQKGYRLAPVCLSLARAYIDSEPMLEAIVPCMRDAAEKNRVNVGIAAADQLEMVYLESVRHGHPGVARKLLPGSRIPIAHTALGCAYLAGIGMDARKKVMDRLAIDFGSSWHSQLEHVNRMLKEVEAFGYCQAQWVAGVCSLATPLPVTDQSVYALNVSFPTGNQLTISSVQSYADLLLELKADILKILHAGY